MSWEEREAERLRESAKRPRNPIAKLFIAQLKGAMSYPCTATIEAAHTVIEACGYRSIVGMESPDGTMERADQDLFEGLSWGATSMEAEKALVQATRRGRTEWLAAWDAWAKEHSGEIAAADAAWDKEQRRQEMIQRINGRFDVAQLRALRHPVAWQGVSAEDRAQYAAQIGDLVAEGLEAIRTTDQAIAVDVADGKITATILGDEK